MLGALLLDRVLVQVIVRTAMISIVLYRQNSHMITPRVHLNCFLLCLLINLLSVRQCKKQNYKRLPSHCVELPTANISVDRNGQE
jgi:hypothetical protein